MLCVFTTGQAWQFKSYRWTDPRELFKHGTSASPFRLERNAYKGPTVRGVYFQLSNDQPHPAIKDWKVQTYKVSLSSCLAYPGALTVPPDRPLCAAYGQADGGRVLVVCGESEALTTRGDVYLADSHFVACYAMYVIWCIVQDQQHDNTL